MIKAIWVPIWIALGGMGVALILKHGCTNPRTFIPGLMLAVAGVVFGGSLMTKREP